MAKVVIMDFDESKVWIDISEEDLDKLSELENRAYAVLVGPSPSSEQEMNNHYRSRSIARGEYNELLGKLFEEGSSKNQFIQTYSPID